MYIETRKTPWFHSNGCKCKGIIFHITADKSYNQAVNWLCSRENTGRSSAALVIEKNGDMFKLVDRWSDRTNHAGIVTKPTAQIYFDFDCKNPNTYMIGVEVVGVPGDKLTDAQKESIVNFLKDMRSLFGIDMNTYWVKGHNEFDTVTRSQDPVSVYTIPEVLEMLAADEVLISIPEPIVEAPVSTKDLSLDADAIVNLVASNNWIKCLNAVENLANIDTDYSIAKYIRGLIVKLWNIDEQWKDNLPKVEISGWEEADNDIQVYINRVSTNPGEWAEVLDKLEKLGTIPSDIGDLNMVEWIPVLLLKVVQYK